MTILEAISGEIEPYSISDNSMEKAFLDSSAHFGASNAVGDDYKPSEPIQKKVVAYASMLCLNRVRVLASENIGGISSSYEVKKLEKRISAIAEDAGLSASLVLASDSDITIDYISI